MTGNENAVEDLIREYFNMYMYAEPCLKSKAQDDGGYVYEVKDKKIAIGCANKLHVGDYNLYFDNQLEEDCVVNYNKLWINMIYSKLKELSPEFADRYSQKVKDYISYVNTNSKQKVEAKYSKLINVLTETIKEECREIDTSAQEVFDIFADDDNSYEITANILNSVLDIVAWLGYAIALGILIPCCLKRYIA